MGDMLGLERFYISVHPQIFRIDTIRTFALYTLNAENRMIFFHGHGDLYTAENHGRIFKENIPALYIRTGDKARYTRYLEENFPFIMDDPLISTEDRAAISHEVLTFLATSIFSNPSAESIANFKKTVEKVVEFVVWDDDAIRYLIHKTENGFQEYNHAVNVGIFGLGLAQDILGNEEGHNMNEIAAGFFLHDIGKFSLPRHISRRNGPLTPDDWNIVRKHPEQGYRMLQTFGALSDEVATIVLQHHERHDGRGYPLGLKGDAIHIYAKICAIADVFDALTSQRPYRTAKSSFQAFGVMQNEMKGEFDPEFFAHFVRLFSKA